MKEKGFKLVFLLKWSVFSRGSRQLAGQRAASFWLAPVHCVRWWGKVRCTDEGHLCSQGSFLQDSVFCAVVPFVMLWDLFWYLLSPHPNFFYFPKKTSSDNLCFLRSVSSHTWHVPKICLIHTFALFRLLFSTACGKLSSSSHDSFCLILTQPISARLFPLFVRWVYHFDWKLLEKRVGQCLT